jgi:hypothetical protein
LKDEDTVDIIAGGMPINKHNTEIGQSGRDFLDLSLLPVLFGEHQSERV